MYQAKAYGKKSEWHEHSGVRRYSIDVLTIAGKPSVFAEAMRSFPSVAEQKIPTSAVRRFLQLFGSLEMPKSY